MAGLHDTDVKLSETWQLTQAANGDAPLCSDLDCFVQDIRLEAITQPGELFYDPDWGWGLLEFLKSEDDELTRLEITERVREKLGRREEITPGSIDIQIRLDNDLLILDVTFEVQGTKQSITVGLDRVNVEVVTLD
ncbi:DUF2634 domain-containing protein [Harryflintia acetispora]|uniref:Phage baseplate assembly protein W n=1 Tax=Harryflintia acetispora TaxID=1849041 RepID=A0A9X8UJ12_9FIRM|nr:DUF2634 domain-containing protein [Harryflintia acetispora]TCL43229.1 phage baseplate assembly protein W [Harryflintia acetispora]